MRKDQDRLTKRLSAISTAKPVDASAAPPSSPASRPRRKEPREPVYRFARIATGRNTVIKCIIRDISPSGARIAMEGSFELPAEVIIATDTGRRLRARVAWRSENEAGLCFLGEAPREPAPAQGLRIALSKGLHE
jgi:hypothetical protein